MMTSQVETYQILKTDRHTMEYKNRQQHNGMKGQKHNGMLSVKEGTMIKL